MYMRSAQRIGSRAAYLGRGSSDDSASPANVDLVHLQMRGWNPFNPIGFNRPSSYMYKTDIMLDDGTMQKNVPTSQPYDISDPVQNLRAIAEAGSKLRKPGRLTTNRGMNVSGLPADIRLATKGAGLVNFNSSKPGASIVAHGFVNFGSGVRGANVTFDTYNHERMNVIGSIRARMVGNVSMNNSYMPGSITVQSGEASMAGVHGNPTINRVKLSSISHAAALHATNEVFTGPQDYYGMPSRTSIQHAALQRDARLGTPNHVFSVLSEAHAAQLKAQMAMQYGQGSVRSRKMERDGLAHPQMA